MKKNLLKTALAAFVMALGTTQTVWAEEVELNPTADTYLDWTVTRLKQRITVQ